jgi:hypothetical protein
MNYWMSLLNWLSNYGTTTILGNDSGDWNGDGYVCFNDLLVLLNEFFGKI